MRPLLPAMYKIIVETVSQSSYQSFTAMSKFLAKVKPQFSPGVGMKENGHFSCVLGSTENHFSKICHHCFQAIEIIERIDNVEWLMTTVNYCTRSGLLRIFKEFHITQVQVR